MTARDGEQRPRSRPAERDRRAIAIDERPAFVLTDDRDDIADDAGQAAEPWLAAERVGGVKKERGKGVAAWEAIVPRHSHVLSRVHECAEGKRARPEGQRGFEVRRWSK